MRYNPKKHHLPICEAAGILPVDKPATWTSFDVVNFVRSRFNIPKVGHCGTLDPAATGLLVLLLGKFTTLSDHLSAAVKQYTGTLKLGIVTDSGDMDGNIIRESSFVTDTELIRRTFDGFIGKSMQLPPMYSAVKVGGKKLYELARQGVEIEREARPIEITELRITRLELPEIDFVVRCSKGTYVRTLASDIGDKLGCGAVLTALRRTCCGDISLDEAVTIEQLKSMDQEAFTAMMAHRLADTLNKLERH